MAWLDRKDSTRLRSAAAITFAVTLVVNAMANILPLNGQTSGQVSDSYPNLFAPAGFTFSIWGVIYLLLAVYVIWQLRIAFHDRRSKLKASTIDKITPYFIISSVLNVLWIITWHYNVIWLSVPLIVGMLYSLARINLELYDKHFSPKERIVVRAPFSVYFGWLTVATIANIITWLVSEDWKALGQSGELWTVIILIFGALVGILGMLRLRDVLYGMVFIWAYTGILVKHVSSTGWNAEHEVIIGALWALIAVLTLISAYVGLRIVRGRESWWRK